MLTTTARVLLEKEKMETRADLTKFLHIMLLIFGLIGPIAYVGERIRSNTSNNAFELAISSAEAGRWVWHLDTDTLEWDAQMFKVFGADKNKWSPNYNGFISCIFPDDVVSVNKVVNLCIKNNVPYQAILRAVTSEGKIVFVRVSGKLSNDRTIMSGIALRAVIQNGGPYIPFKASNNNILNFDDVYSTSNTKELTDKSYE